MPGFSPPPLSCSSSGRGKWTAHTLRHRFGTKAYQHSSDLRVVQELLGHHSPATTAIYTEVSDDSRRGAAEAALIWKEPNSPHLRPI
jgi:site-specific recombinase XerD